MGRRATSTTKGGKYMNPTDQARKEARRRELKKNKKQRMAVRQAVIKTKDPKQMLAELDMLDEMELNPASNVPYNDKVVREKRIKLLENVQRITQYYLREDPEQGTELKRLVDNYRKDRLKKEVYYESVRNAQKVKIDSIPLPDAPFQTPQLSDIPLPGVQPQGILKKTPSYMISAPTTVVQKEPPGPPPGPPPLKKKFKGNDPLLRPRPPPGPPPTDLASHSRVDDKDAYDPEEGPVLGDNHSDDDEKSDDEFQHRDEDDEPIEKRRRHSRDNISDDEDGDSKHTRLGDAGITPLQAMMLKLAGQAIPNKSTDEDLPSTSTKKVGFADNQQKPPPGPPPGLPPGPPSMPPRMVPPGPPPGVPPTLPRGPPPGLPPALQMRMNVPPGRQSAPSAQEMFGRTPQADKNPANVLSAPPSLVHHRQEKDQSRPGMIVAKPQIINNPRADVTRFMPTSLRVKRESMARIGPNRPQDVEMPITSSEKQRQEKGRKQSKVNADIAYDSFMKEMKGLL